MAPRSNCHRYHEPGEPCSNLDRVKALVNSFPPLHGASITSAYQKVLAQSLRKKVPNNKVATKPPPHGHHTYVTYGSDHYREAFTYAESISEGVGMLHSLTPFFLWDSFSVALLHDEISKNVTVSLDTAALTSTVNRFWSEIVLHCAAVYTAAFKCEYDPTRSAIRRIPESQRGSVAQQLHSCIKSGHFTAKVNIGISAGGDAAQQATWFLFNLWVSLDVLGYPRVDDAIQQYQSQGLKVPYNVQAGNWNSGSYHSWFQRSLGNHMYHRFMTRVMRELCYNCDKYNEHIPDGYSLSTCYWGPLARYTLPSQSCFGESTKVLMADGSAKCIKNVRKNDLVHTTKGKRRVLMVESPALGDRQMWNVNGLELSVTAGHCFRTANAGAAKRVAINEIVTMDSAPTMSIDGGVGKCQQGSQLRSVCVKNGTLTESTLFVTDVRPIMKKTRRSEKQEDAVRVFDILVEKWWDDDASYFVGGPKNFVAVDAETSNALTDPSTSAAILAAMDVALKATRASNNPPLKTLSRLGANIDLQDIKRGAMAMVYSKRVQKTYKRLRIPKATLFESEDGKWSECASFLEYLLISKYGRWIRSVVRTDFESGVEEALPDDVLVFAVHDIELSGDHGLPAGSTLRIAMELSNGEEKESRTVCFTNDTSSNQYMLAVHGDCAFESADKFKCSAIYATCSIDISESTLAAFFNCSVILKKRPEHFLETFLMCATNGVIGRVSLSYRRMRKGFAKARTADQSTMLLKGVALGRQLGHKFAAAIEETSEGFDFGNWLGD